MSGDGENCNPGKPLTDPDPAMPAWPRVALVFVPQGEPSMPHLALPTLKAYLQTCHKVSADLFDLNLTFYRQLLSRDGITSLILQLDERGLPARDPLLRPHLEQLKEDISGTVALLDGRAWDPARYTWALDKVADACALFGLVHNEYALSLKNLSLPGWDMSSDGLGHWVENPENPFIAFFEPYLERLASYDLVGLSLSWMGQMVPLFVLARLLKQRFPSIRIVLGGSLLPYFLEGLLGAEQLMKDIDLLIPFEGERPLAGVVASMRQGDDPGKVAGVLTCGAGKRKPWLFRRDSVPLAADAIPSPDFTGLPIEDYLSPQACLPIIASRGCYYGQCTFCNHFHHVTAHRVRPVSKVLVEIQALHGRYGVRHFFFVDDSMPVATLQGLSKGLRDAPSANIRFMAEIRLEESLKRPVLEQAASAGCHALLFGLESGSQKTLDRMCKGINLQVARRVLKDAHAAGILTWCFFIVGYPGESLDEITATFRLLEEQCRDIDVIAGGPFVMSRPAPLSAYGSMPGLSVDEAVSDLCLTLGWHHPESPTPEDLDRVFMKAEDALGSVYPRLPFFVEAHMFAFQQEDYQDRLVYRGAPEE